MNIPISADFVLYLCQFLAMVVVVAFLEFVNKRKFLGNGRALWPVVWAVAQVGLIVLARLHIAPLEAGSAQEGAIAAWWMVFWSFISTFIPVALWVGLINHRQVMELVKRAGND